MPTLLLDNFLDQKYSNWFSGYHSDELEIYRAPEGDLPNPGDLSRYDHVILSGSEDSVVEDHDWVETELGLVRELAKLQIPTIGFCYGHQLIARALAGREAVRHTLTPEFGWHEIKLNEPSISRDDAITDDGYKKNQTSNDLLFSGLSPSFHAFNSHFDEVVLEAIIDSGGFQVLAFSANCAVQALKVRDAPIWGTQFHPEIKEADGVLFLTDIDDHIEKAGHNVEVAKATRKRADAGMSKRLFENFYRA